MSVYEKKVHKISPPEEEACDDINNNRAVSAWQHEIEKKKNLENCYLPRQTKSNIKET